MPINSGIPSSLKFYVTAHTFADQQTIKSLAAEFLRPVFYILTRACKMSSLENQQILEQLSAQVRVLQAQVSEASPMPRETTGTEPYSRRYTRSSTGN